MQMQIYKERLTSIEYKYKNKHVKIHALMNYANTASEYMRGTGLTVKKKLDRVEYHERNGELSDSSKRRMLLPNSNIAARS